MHTKSGGKVTFIFVFNCRPWHEESPLTFFTNQQISFPQTECFINLKVLILDLFSWFLFKIFLGQFKMASAPSASRSEFIVGGKYRLVRQSNFFALLRFRCKTKTNICSTFWLQTRILYLFIEYNWAKIELNMSPSTRKEVV